jgi:hypothetical protein
MLWERNLDVGFTHNQSAMNMSTRWQSAVRVVQGSAFAFALAALAWSGAAAQGIAPLQRLAGQWNGSGTISFSDGSHEAIRCQADYDVLEQQRNVQLRIHCASESYSFDLRGTATDTAGVITGSWSEATRNASGTISGRAHDDRFEVLAKSPSFSATLTLITRGDRQSIDIKSQDAKTAVKGAQIALKRG